MPEVAISELRAQRLRPPESGPEVDGIDAEDEEQQALRLLAVRGEEDEFAEIGEGRTGWIWTRRT